MARVALTTQVIDDDGLLPVYSAGTDNGATYTVDGDANYIEIVNGSAGTRAITVQTGGTFEGNALADVAVSIPAGERRKVSLRKKRSLLRPTGGADAGKVYVDVDTVASVTAGAFR